METTGSRGSNLEKRKDQWSLGSSRNWSWGHRNALVHTSHPKHNNFHFFLRLITDECFLNRQNQSPANCKAARRTVSGSQWALSVSPHAVCLVPKVLLCHPSSSQQTFLLASLSSLSILSFVKLPATRTEWRPLTSPCFQKPGSQPVVLNLQPKSQWVTLCFKGK